MRGATARSKFAFLRAVATIPFRQLAPARSRIPPGARRQLVARALDADGRSAAGEVSFAWVLEGAGALEVDDGRAAYTAPKTPCSAAVAVTAAQGEASCSARAEVVVTDEPRSGEGVGIPEPVAVHAQGESWRSRVREGQWEYNASHRDYVAASQTEARRLRYLVHLFAKEIVLRNFGGGGDAGVLERMVEVLTYLQEGGRG